MCFRGPGGTPNRIFKLVFLMQFIGYKKKCFLWNAINITFPP